MQCLWQDADGVDGLHGPIKDPGASCGAREDPTGAPNPTSRGALPAAKCAAPSRSSAALQVPTACIRSGRRRRASRAALATPSHSSDRFAQRASRPTSSRATAPSSQQCTMPGQLTAVRGAPVTAAAAAAFGRSAVAPPAPRRPAVAALSRRELLGTGAAAAALLPPAGTQGAPVTGAAAMAAGAGSGAAAMAVAAPTAAAFIELGELRTEASVGRQEAGLHSSAADADKALPCSSARARWTRAACSGWRCSPRAGASGAGGGTPSTSCRPAARARWWSSCTALARACTTGEPLSAGGVGAEKIVLSLLKAKEINVAWRRLQRGRPRQPPAGCGPALLWPPRLRPATHPLRLHTHPLATSQAVQRA